MGLGCSRGERGAAPLAAGKPPGIFWQIRNGLWGDDVVLEHSASHSEHAELGVGDGGVEGGAQGQGEGLAGFARVYDAIVPQAR